MGWSTCTRSRWGHVSRVESWLAAVVRPGRFSMGSAVARQGLLQPRSCVDAFCEHARRKVAARRCTEAACHQHWHGDLCGASPGGALICPMVADQPRCWLARRHSTSRVCSAREPLVDAGACGHPRHGRCAPCTHTNVCHAIIWAAAALGYSRQVGHTARHMIGGLRHRRRHKVAPGADTLARTHTPASRRRVALRVAAWP